MIIDCHGHYTTAPQAHTAWRREQKEAFAATWGRRPTRRTRAIAHLPGQVYELNAQRVYPRLAEATDADSRIQAGTGP
jgi:hypothetical protein